jgi:probable addiction module antidote protein
MTKTNKGKVVARSSVRLRKCSLKPPKKSLKFSPSVDYHDELMTFLKDQANAVEYLNAALAESLKGDEESRAIFLRALKNIAEAQGSISTLAKRSRICRESIYRILSANGNPEMQTLAALLGALGLGLKVYDISSLKS